MEEKYPSPTKEELIYMCRIPVCVEGSVRVCKANLQKELIYVQNGRRAIKDGVQQKMAMNEHQRAVKLVLPHQQNPLCAGHCPMCSGH